MNASQRKPPAIGIDLGTTFSVSARLDDLGRTADVINAVRGTDSRTALSFEGENIVVGKEAVKGPRPSRAGRRGASARPRQPILQNSRRPPLSARSLQAWVLNSADRSQKQIRPVFETVDGTGYFDEVYPRKATWTRAISRGWKSSTSANEPTAAPCGNLGSQQGFTRPDHTRQCRSKIGQTWAGHVDVTVGSRRTKIQ